MEAMRSFEMSAITDPDIQRKNAGEQNHIAYCVALKYKSFSLDIVHIML
jgi:hypothetical protein